MRRPRLPLVALLVLPAVAVAAPTGPSEPVVAAGSELAVVMRPEGPTLVGAATTALPLEAGAVVGALVGGDGGWALGATLASEEGVELRWVEGRGAEATEVAGPAGVRAAVVRSPRPLLRDGRLAAAAWLEGAEVTALAVRAARRLGDGWSAIDTVAPPGPGSQLALSSATLADGSWLLVWSAFDGQDDEVLWSRFDGRAWTRPARVAAGNAVPDVTPHVAATAAGAVVAWSRYDGRGYEVVVSRFQGDGWSAPVPVAARGAHFPTVEVGSEAVSVLFQRAVPAGWGLVELDRYDAPSRLAFVASTRDDRPHVVPLAGGGVRFRWEGEAAEAVGAWTASE